MKANKAGLRMRRESALQRLLESYASFKEEGQDKRLKNGTFRKFEHECARMEKEIETLKSRI